MKKLIICISIAAMIISGTAALAAEYTPKDNSVGGIGSDKYKTVLIVKDGETAGDNDILYVGQDENGFDAAAKFLLRDDPADGLYLIKLGGTEKGSAPDVSKFYVGMPISADDEKCDKTFIEDGTVAFGWDCVSSEECRSIIVKLDGNVYGYDFGTRFTGGDLSVGVKINGVPDAIAETNAYLSGNSIQYITGGE